MFAISKKEIIITENRNEIHSSSFEESHEQIDKQTETFHILVFILRNLNTFPFPVKLLNEEKLCIIVGIYQ